MDRSSCFLLVDKKLIIKQLESIFANGVVTIRIWIETFETGVLRDFFFHLRRKKSFEDVSGVGIEAF